MANGCRVWGDWDGHYYADEDSGEYRPFCECGAVDPAWRDPETVRVYKSDPNDPNDQPPF